MPDLCYSVDARGCARGDLGSLGRFECSVSLGRFLTRYSTGGGNFRVINWSGTPADDVVAAEKDAHSIRVLGTVRREDAW
jgi:hypothetical protein